MGVLHGNRDRVEPPDRNLAKSRDPLADPIRANQHANKIAISLIRLQLYKSDWWHNCCHYLMGSTFGFVEPENTTVIAIIMNESTVASKLPGDGSIFPYVITLNWNQSKWTDISWNDCDGLSLNWVVYGYPYSIFQWVSAKKRNSSALAMGLLLSCTNPSIFAFDVTPKGSYVDINGVLCQATYWKRHYKKLYQLRRFNWIRNKRF